MANRTNTRLHEVVLWLLLVAGFVGLIAGMAAMNVLITIIGLLTTLVAAVKLVESAKGGTR